MRQAALSSEDEFELALVSVQPVVTQAAPTAPTSA